MNTALTWLGHGTWLIESAGKKILLDPFLNDSPTAPLKAEQVEADYILVSHGHFDHVADCVAIAKRTGAVVVSNYEICQWLGSQGVSHTLPHNLGGGSQLPFGRVELTPALHSSQLPDGSYGGNPSGFLLSLAEGNLYFACDTALFSDMRLVGERGVVLAVVPIGDVFTMGPEASLAAIRLIAPRVAAPAHYNTWPPIAQDAEAWAEQVRSQTQAKPWVPQAGQRYTLSELL